MNKGINKIRDSIKKRKLLKKHVKPAEDSSLPYHASIEEKHGFYNDTLFDTQLKQPSFKQNRTSLSFLMKVMGSILLFVATGILFQTNSERLTSLKQYVTNSFQEELPFARFHAWYEMKLGSPLAFAPKSELVEDGVLALPVTGAVVESFAANQTGIFIAPEKGQAIHSFQKGVVIFAGNDPLTKKTVKIQHADGSNTTYGYLSSVDVHVYEIVQKNEIVGSFQPSDENELVFFSIEQEDEYIDPAKVIKVDYHP